MGGVGRGSEYDQGTLYEIIKQWIKYHLSE